ncbi:hypothetical protein [Saccharothrix obliqua]|uniref:hypothetical protein n=1 Tax=Saccharothrix obliqua TaxID=2861747 RepID=UPI001C606D92|nr:hypothetical protein [Saccharothrix obliqua]MBW4722005.1 hypothetical protein [Saccharothrix obliqua]
MTEPDESELARNRALINEAEAIARDLRETTPDPFPESAEADEADQVAEEGG